MANSVRRLDMPDLVHDMVHEEFTIPGLGSIVDIAIPKACNPSQRTLQPYVSRAAAPCVRGCNPISAHTATACRV